MSASLVGSEMCIRDRPTAHAIHPSLSRVCTRKALHTHAELPVWEIASEMVAVIPMEMTAKPSFSEASWRLSCGRRQDGDALHV
eukprot:14098292-Alexandrium_andersonii.AAC.1